MSRGTQLSLLIAHCGKGKVGVLERESGRIDLPDDPEYHRQGTLTALQEVDQY